MSYCRWSSDYFNCDLYCYESNSGYETHVAAYRRRLWYRLYHGVVDKRMPLSIGDETVFIRHSRMDSFPKWMTHKTIQLLNHYKINYLIVTKSDLVATDEYLKIYDKKLAHFQMSLTFTNDNQSLKHEKASLPSERIRAIEKLYNEGFDVSIRLSPFIDCFADTDKINLIKCGKILIEFLKANHFTKKWFDIDYSKHVLRYGGYYHLPIEEKIRLQDKITEIKEKSIGEYVVNHHEYFSQNINFNKNDCCNLSLKLPIYPHYYQQELFN
jgi:DNA repair photolyase